jgi:hypothetical protein
MPDNYILLEKIVVGAASPDSVTFSNIPQTGYTDLILKGTVKTTQAATYGLLGIRPNGSTSSITGIRMYGGDGNAYADDTPTLAFISGTSTESNTFGSFETYITNYAGSGIKTFSSESTGERNQTNDTYMGVSTILWSNTAAITSLQIMPQAVGFVEGSTFYLYGVAKLNTTPAISPMATGGDVIMTDGTYWYHAFRSSGTFTPLKALSCDVLVVAGGGGGGYYNGGGGGAGGLQAFTSQSISSSKTITIGAGAPQPAGYVDSSNGNDSTFQGLTASVGGGRGSGYYTTSSAVGGSGGGGGMDYNTTGSAGTAGQGNAGANGNGTTVAGGGGGAGGVGQSGAAGGAGGVGSSTYSSWGSVTGTGQNVSGTYYYAGGGGWLTGGSGGGGANTSSGVANTGGGGGCGKGSTSGSGGGSGIVIVRYAV